MAHRVRTDGHLWITGDLLQLLQGDGVPSAYFAVRRSSIIRRSSTMQPRKEPVALDDAGRDKQCNRYAVLADQWQYIIEQLFAAVVERQPYCTFGRRFAAVQDIQQFVGRDERVAILGQPPNASRKKRPVWLMKVNCRDHVPRQRAVSRPTHTTRDDETESEQCAKSISKKSIRAHLINPPLSR